MSNLTKQDLHNLGMNIVGEDLKKRRFEFLAVNSDMKKNPQFIVQNDGDGLTFVVVKTVLYPEDPDNFDRIWMETFKSHAKDKNATLYFAGVGLANSEDMTKPLNKENGYIVKYNGLKKI